MMRKLPADVDHGLEFQREVDTLEACRLLGTATTAEIAVRAGYENDPAHAAILERWRGHGWLRRNGETWEYIPLENDPL